MISQAEAAKRKAEAELDRILSHPIIAELLKDGLGADHAVLSASGSHTWLKCHGSLWLKLLLNFQEPQNQEFKQEGNQAHDIAAEILLGNDPDTSGFDDDLLGMVLEYTNHCEELLSLPDGFGTQIEAKLILHAKLAMFGTTDFVRLVKKEDLIHAYICDLKFGVGVKVEADWNPQLMYYAAALYELWKYRGIEIDIFNMVIYQPRVVGGSDSPFSSFSCTAEEILKFKSQLLATAQTVLRMAAGLEKPTFNPGYHQCKFCPVRNLCIARLESFGIKKEKLDLIIKNKKISKMTEEEYTEEFFELMTLALLAGSKMTSFVSDSKALAKQMEEAGKAIPGIETSKRRGNKTLPKDPLRLEQLKTYLASNGVAFYEDKPKSISKFEKELGEPIPESFLDFEDDRFVFKPKTEDE